MGPVGNSSAEDAGQAQGSRSAIDGSPWLSFQIICRVVWDGYFGMTELSRSTSWCSSPVTLESKFLFCRNSVAVLWWGWLPSPLSRNALKLNWNWFESDVREKMWNWLHCFITQLKCTCISSVGDCMESKKTGFKCYLRVKKSLPVWKSPRGCA